MLGAAGPPSGAASARIHATTRRSTGARGSVRPHLQAGPARSLVNPTTPILPLWIIAVLRLFWRNVVPQAGRAIGYNQKKSAKSRIITRDSTDGRALARRFRRRAGL